MIDSANYKLGVGVIDHQHAHLLSLINTLARGGAEMGALISAFADYADRHFAVEEALMEAHDYPARVGHVEAHAAYRAKFVSLVGEALEGNALVSRAMLAFLEKWWTEHIQGVDRNLADYLREKGMCEPLE